MTNQDRNFNDIANKFTKNIYGTTKGKIREIIVWQDIEQILKNLPDDRPLTILDAGGGQGQFATKLAKLGHDVTICDISNDMLELAKYRAKNEHVILNYIHCAIQDLPNSFSGQFDLVLCHAVLEWVSDPLLILSLLKKQLKSNGILSLMYYNLHGLRFRTITLGNFGYAQAGLAKRKKKTLSPDYPRDPNDVAHWLDSLNFTILKKTGIRIFHDYLIDKNKQQTHFDELLQLEQQYCRQEPYIHLARYVHMVLKTSN